MVPASQSPRPGLANTSCVESGSRFRLTLPSWLNWPIWVLGGAGIAGLLGGAAFGFGWMIFHLLVIPLQAFIFTMLTIVYLSLAEEHH